jgi:hypothetical protein
MKTKAHEILSRFLATTTNPSEYTAVAAVLYRIVREVDLEVLQGMCTSIPLALGLGVRALIDSGMQDRARELFEHFVYAGDSALSVSDKAKVLPTFIQFLRKGGGTLADIRKAEALLFDLERMLRARMLDDRREITKDTSNPSAVLDRWVKHLRAHGPGDPSPA